MDIPKVKSSFLPRIALLQYRIHHLICMLVPLFGTSKTYLHYLKNACHTYSVLLLVQNQDIKPELFENPCLYHSLLQWNTLDTISRNMTQQNNSSDLTSAPSRCIYSIFCVGIQLLIVDVVFLKCCSTLLVAGRFGIRAP